MQITETFYPKNRGKWRDWLSKHHDQKKEIWVIYYKKHTGKPTVPYQDAVEEALCFGWTRLASASERESRRVDGIEKRIDEERYTGRFSPRRPKSSWTETNVGRYKMLVEQGLMTEVGTSVFEDRKKS